MASLTEAPDNVINKAHLDTAATDLKVELDLAADAISKLAQFEIEEQFEYSPIEIDQALYFGIKEHAHIDPALWGIRNPSDNISFAGFSPNGELKPTDIPSDLTDTLEEAIIDSDVPAFPSDINLPEALELDQNYTKPTAPNVEVTVVPDAPADEVVNVPVLNDVVLPTLYEANIPLYEAALPVIPDDFASPANEFEFDGGATAFTSPEIEALEAILLDDLENGGYGVLHTDEEDIFNREVDRETSLAQAAEDELIDSFGSRGFLIPSGVLLDQIGKLQQATQNKITTINRDTAIQRADLVRATRAATQENVINLAQVLTTYQGFAYERLLKAKQFAASYSLDSFQASVNLYNLKVQVFESEITAFRSQIEAEIAKLEQNKSQLESARLAQDINEADIAIYNAQLNGVQINSNIYNSKVAAAKIRSEIQNDKLQKYQIEFEIYQAEIQVDVTRIALQQAQINNESARVEFYRAELASYVAKLDASKTQESIYLARFDASVKKKGIELENYTKKENLYTTQLQQEKDDINLRLELFNSESSAHDERTRAYTAYMDSRIAQNKFNVDQQGVDLNWTLKNEEFYQQSLQTKIGVETELLKVKILGITKMAEALSNSISHSDIVIS